VRSRSIRNIGNMPPEIPKEPHKQQQRLWIIVVHQEKYATGLVYSSEKYP
jgi:hypothetical protein